MKSNFLERFKKYMERDHCNNINHPEHYQSEYGIEVIDIIDSFGLNFNIGNSIKYILRAGRKTDDKIEDFKKAMWYINREIESLSK